MIALLLLYRGNSLLAVTAAGASSLYIFAKASRTGYALRLTSLCDFDTHLATMLATTKIGAYLIDARKCFA